MIKSRRLRGKKAATEVKPKISSNLLGGSTSASYGGRGQEIARLRPSRKIPRRLFYLITFDQGNDRKKCNLNSQHQLGVAWIQSEIT
jgi:hypothetical protein